MKRKTWYKIALLLPVIFPFFVVLLGLPVMAVHFDTGTQIMGVGMLLFTFFMLGAPTYLVFCLLLGWWMKNKTADQMKIASWFLPLIYLPFFATTYVFYLHLVDKSGILIPLGESIVGGTILSSTILLPCAYFYVGLSHLLTALFRKTGWVQD